MANTIYFAENCAGNTAVDSENYFIPEHHDFSF